LIGWPYFPKGQHDARDNRWCIYPGSKLDPKAGAFSMTVYAWSEQIAKAPGRLAKGCRLDLVQQAERLALANLDRPLNIAALCQMLAVSERTLRKAFRIAYGLSPCRHLRMLRLLRVRQALMSSSPYRVTTVTEIATHFGFGELGRFSVEYRRAFGESPSVTLRLALEHARQ
jgi:transcriptional regulator GlxA family with amidase domain